MASVTPPTDLEDDTERVGKGGLADQLESGDTVGTVDGDADCLPGDNVLTAEDTDVGDEGPMSLSVRATRETPSMTLSAAS